MEDLFTLADHQTLAGKLFQAEGRINRGDLLIVDHNTALLDETASLTVAGAQAALDQQRNDADLSAAQDATLIFYSVDRDADGTITDISFNFVAKPEFDARYTLL